MNFQYFPKQMLLVLALSIISTSTPAASHNKSLLDVLGFPRYPGSKLMVHTIVPPGPMLESLEKEVGGALPVSAIQEVNVATYSIDSVVDGLDVVKFYNSAFDAKKWKTMVTSVSRAGDVTVILTKENVGMLIIDVDQPGQGRELNLILVSGTVDTSKIDSAFAERAGALIDTKLKPGIPPGSPISVPPSEKLDIMSVKSNIHARFDGQNITQIDLVRQADNAGDLIRTPDGRLLLNLTPDLDVKEVLLPTGVPILLEPTNGSLTITCGPGANEKPMRLNIVSTGAPVKLESFPLVSGTHNIQVVGKSLEALLGQVTGGVMEVEAEGGSIVLGLHANASARINATVVSGSIHNSLTRDKPIDNNINFKMGDGKAQITLKAVNGSIILKRI